ASASLTCFQSASKFCDIISNGKKKNNKNQIQFLIIGVVFDDNPKSVQKYSKPSYQQYQHAIKIIIKLKIKKNIIIILKTPWKKN
ncbi:MAG: hypothetical protein J5595_06805, partial [Bacteroidales bacterium]|nr:hypothetical protein [Bacteroidales bacterium]